MKHIVTFGGGNGTATTLRALKKLEGDFDISAVVSVSDSGGSSGRLREEFNTLPAGDILRAILASSPLDYKEILKPMFHGVRFDVDGKLQGHNLGNLFLVFAAQYAGDFVQAIRALEQAVQSRATVYPVSLTPHDLVVELNSGEEVRTEAEIDRPTYDRSKRIVRAWLDPQVETYEHALQVAKKADYIIFGPGSLYCSIVPTLLTKGMKDAIQQSSAKLIYVAGNAYEQNGESGPSVLSEFVKELQEYLPRKIDYILYNNSTLSDEQLEEYKKKQWGVLECDVENLSEYTCIAKPFESAQGGLSPDQLAHIFFDIIQ